MNTYLTTRFGSDLKNPSGRQIDEALAELTISDEEHPDVSFRNEDEWSISVFPSGKVILENLEEGDPLHMKGASIQKVKELWALIAVGDIETLKKDGWKPGYGNE